MENFENLSQEELLQAAQEAYEKELKQRPHDEKEEEAPIDQPLCDSQEEAIVQEQTEPATEDAPDEAKTASINTISTSGTAIGIAAGLVVGGISGFLTGLVPACLTLGVLLGVLLGLLFDVKKDKKSVPPKAQQESAPSILEINQEEHCNE